jgi:hypothetical protein
VERCPEGWACAAVTLFGDTDRTLVCLPRPSDACADCPEIADSGGQTELPDASADAVTDPGVSDPGGDGPAANDPGADLPQGELAPQDTTGDAAPRCGDGVCRPDLGESVASCPGDCSVCGDRVCSPGEAPQVCPEDCCAVQGAGAGCGDGLCIGYGCGENPESCPQDCGTACGDGICDRGESPEACPVDCAAACGDCLCEGGESFVDCPVDCGGGSSCRPLPSGGEEGPRFCAGSNFGVPRADASLEIIFVATGTESSQRQISFYLTAFRDLKGTHRPDLVHAHLVAGLELDGCEASGVKAEPAVNYRAVASATGGTTASVCDTGYDRTLLELGKRVLGPPRELPLTRRQAPSGEAMYRGGERCHDYILDSVNASVRVEPGGDCDVGDSEDLRYSYYTLCY